MFSHAGALQALGERTFDGSGTMPLTIDASASTAPTESLIHRCQMPYSTSLRTGPRWSPVVQSSTGPDYDCR
jgi:hypothetical protein